MLKFQGLLRRPLFFFAPWVRPCNGPACEREAVAEKLGLRWQRNFALGLMVCAI